MTQASIGPSVGGQAYAEFVFFNDMKALDQFKRSDFTFAAQVSAVVLKSGASANAKYADGVAVFTLSQQGLMLEAAIGGQHFAYEAK
jgi:lipid-binding SYLF domain-containing protein